MRALWNPIWDIALNDLRVIFRERGIWLNIIVIPIALAVLVGLANGAGAGQQPTPPTVIVDVIDQDGSPTSAALLDAVRAANPTLALCPFDNDDADRCRLDDAALDEALSEARLRGQRALALLIIPPGFGAQVAAGTPVSLIYRSNENAFAPTFIRQAVDAAAQQVGGAAAAERVGLAVADNFGGLVFRDDADRTAFGANIRESAAESWAADLVTVDYQLTVFDAQQEIADSGGGFAQSFPGMATMYVMFAVFPAASAFILERKQWTMQRLATMPVTRAQILGGKMLARFLLGMLQYVIMFAAGFALGTRYGNDIVALALLMTLFVLAITALTLALTTLLRSDMQAQGVTLFLSIVMAPLGGAWWPLEIMPDFMQAAARITPVAWVMEGYRSLIFEGGSLAMIVPSLAVLGAMAALLFAFGVSRFKVE
jgi:ABC-2 type transport system permease protein